MFPHYFKNVPLPFSREGKFDNCGKYFWYKLSTEASFLRQLSNQLQFGIVA